MAVLVGHNFSNLNQYFQFQNGNIHRSLNIFANIQYCSLAILLIHNAKLTGLCVAAAEDQSE